MRQTNQTSSSFYVGLFILFATIIFITFVVEKRPIRNEPNVNLTKTGPNNNLTTGPEYCSNRNLASPHVYPRLEETLLDPYAPPLRNDYSSQEQFRQVGILTPTLGSEKVSGKNKRQDEHVEVNQLILPLMGKPICPRSLDKWNFFSMNNKNTMLKLPMTFKGRSCMNEYGCDNIYNGDIVYVEGYKHAFKATIYETQNIHYSPF